MEWHAVGDCGEPFQRMAILSGFLGSYLHQMDEKGRVSLPAAFRRDAGECPMVLVQVHTEALTLYPAEAWSGVEERLRELLRRQPEARPYVLGISARAVEIVPDKQGRILVPQRLATSAGIGGAALLVGMIDRVEIWDPDRFESIVATPSVEFQGFTSQVFG
jgi:MraZ protein